MEEKLTLRQQRFIDAYILCGNASKSVVDAGFKTKYPDKYAAELLRSPKIKAILGKTRENMQKESKITQEWVLNELRDIALSNKEKNADTAIKAHTEICKILGIYAPTKTENKNTNTEVSEPFEHMEKRAHEYASKRIN